ncbi:MAG: hypothetical protein FWG80_01825 [Alphaproteobacteria bacterium]|nr:hypothetical protein [Alphaproteobacteria bacterium]
MEINKANRKQYVGVQGVYAVLSDNKPVLKTNGKPWSGRTNSMGNYYGVIVGSAKYTEYVKLGAVWCDGYKIMFTANDEQI